VGPQEAVGLGEVHPFQQMRVAGRVATAIRSPATHPLVDPADRLDQGLGSLDGAERRGRQEGAGAL
jgi:hypothetical protein